jgi:hypothetical protein
VSWTPLTASGPQPVGTRTASQPDLHQATRVTVTEDEGSGEWAPEGLDCYSLDLDSTWEVVEKVRNWLLGFNAV